MTSRYDRNCRCFGTKLGKRLMSTIKLTHTHPDGKRCYAMRSSRSLTDMGAFHISQKECIVAYMPYTGHWYAFNPETGEEIASFTDEFYKEHICQYRVTDLLRDPDCTVM